MIMGNVYERHHTLTYDQILRREHDSDGKAKSLLNVMNSEGDMRPGTLSLSLFDPMRSYRNRKWRQKSNIKASKFFFYIDMAFLVCMLTLHRGILMS